MFAPIPSPPDGAQPQAVPKADSTANPRKSTHPDTSHVTPRQPAAVGAASPAGPNRPYRPAGTEIGAASASGEVGDGHGDDDLDYDSSSLDDELQQGPDPLYDEAADDRDAAWADRQRCGRVSDAVLSCPGCFTTLCIDCQRHERYHQQYRAMFVMNCQVEQEDQEEGSGSGAGRGGGGARRGFDPSSDAAAAGGRRPKRVKSSAAYRRVRCGVCGTEVGALEVEEELYHFYHVFPSNA